MSLLVLVHSLAGAGGPCNLGAAAHTPGDMGTLTSPPSVSALLSAALLPQTQVLHPATLPYTKANQLHTSLKIVLALTLGAGHAAESRHEQGSSSSWLYTFPWEAEPAAWWRWPFQLSQVPRNSWGLLSSLLLSSPPPVCPPRRRCARLLRQLVPPTPSQQLWA